MKDRPSSDDIADTPTGDSNDAEDIEGDALASSQFQPMAVGCALDILAMLLGIGVWAGSALLCFYYNQSLVGILIAAGLVPFVLESGTSTAAFVLVFQLGWRVFWAVFTLPFRLLMHLPKRLFGDEDEPPGIFIEITEDLSLWPIGIGFAVGAGIASFLGALALGLGGTDAGLIERTIVICAYHVVAALILASFGFRAA